MNDKFDHLFDELDLYGYDEELISEILSLINGLKPYEEIVARDLIGARRYVELSEFERGKFECHVDVAVRELKTKCLVRTGFDRFGRPIYTRIPGSDKD
jgi:hypothetical protein